MFYISEGKMKYYNVKEISEILKTNPETVRRWIRKGKLVAKIDSKKEGSFILESDFKKFLNANPKYAGIAYASLALTPLGIPLIVAKIVGETYLNSIKNNQSMDTEKLLLDRLKKEQKRIMESIEKNERKLIKLEEQIKEEKNQLKDITKEIKKRE